MNLSAISDLLFREKGVHEAFVHQCEKLEFHRSTRVAGGGWNGAHERTRHFRVGIWNDKGKYGEAEHANLWEAIVLAMKQAGLKEPGRDFFGVKEYEADAKSWGSKQTSHLATPA